MLESVGIQDPPVAAQPHNGYVTHAKSPHKNISSLEVQYRIEISSSGSNDQVSKQDTVGKRKSYKAPIRLNVISSETIVDNAEYNYDATRNRTAMQFASCSGERIE